MPRVSSTAIDRVEWANNVLTIWFDSGGRYDYPGVPERLYLGLIAANSKGSFFNQYIRGRFGSR